MLLSDRDIRAQVEAGRIALDPWDPAMVQPSSVDVRIDKWFRLFDNHKYAVIDPAEEQPDLTRLVEVDPDEPFVLHPGEFVLASTYELVTLPDDVASRVEGKALSIDTPVPVPGGWSTMGDLRPGDQVLDLRGQPCRVVAATTSMLDRPCRRVRFSDGSEFIADAAHLWLTRTKSDRSTGRPGIPRTTDDVAASLTAGREWNHHVQLAGPAAHPPRELPVDPYVLGLWLGDGTTTTADITVGSEDVEVLEHVRAAGHAVWHRGRLRYRVGGLEEGLGRRDARRDPSTGRYGADGSLRSALRALGVLGNKHVPDAYLTAAPAQRLALLQGLMDSDGYVDVAGRCEFVNTNERLADAVAELAASLGLRPKQRKKRAMLHGVDCGPAFQVKFTPRIPVFRLRRKAARLLTGGGGHQFRAVVAVEPVPSVPVRCIEVDAPDGMFLVGRRYVPTHNSSLGRLGLLTHSTAGFIDPGFSGHITLELSNVATLPIKLWPGMKIGQLCFFRLTGPAEHPYGSERSGSRYQGQRGPTASRSFRSFTRARV